MGIKDKSYNQAIKNLAESQQSDHDGRERAREADHFVNKIDGQWEPSIISMYNGRPRYTFDKVSGVVADICGEMASMDFDISVKPAGGPSTTDIAMHYDGLIRNIQNSSTPSASKIFKAAGKQMVTTGIGGWGVINGYRDSKSFNQDLIIIPISNFMDRVWLDPGSEQRDGSDSDWGFFLTSMSMQDYKRDFPKGGGMSLGRDLTGNVYEYKKSDAVVVGAYYYKVRKTQDLVLMSDESVYLDDDDFKKVKDELEANGITEERRRKTDAVTVFHRMLDGSAWLTEERETVFDYIPLVPVYANYEISEDKMIYWGAVEKLMDPQRVLNYAESRKIEEGALAPRAKKWITQEQAAGHEQSIRTMNTNADPVQFYNHVADQPPPFETGGAQINPGLMETTQAMEGHIRSTAGTMDPSQQNGAMGLQSGVALQLAQNKGDVTNQEYFLAMEVAIAHTCKLIIGAIPKVYDSKREIRLDSQDGTTKTVTINERVFDEDSGEVVEMNDLSKGAYSVFCTSGPAFNNKQQETRQAFTDLAGLDPSILQVGSDILLNNIPAPGMPQLAKRKRAMMIQQGIIPEDEFTDEEKEQAAAQAQAAQGQQQEPSAMEQAVMAQAQAEQEKAAAGTADIQSKIEERQHKAQMAERDSELKAATLEQNQTQMEAKAGQSLKEIQMKEQDQVMEMLKIQGDQIKKQAETLKILYDAMGVDSIVGPTNMEAYTNQADLIVETQEGLS